MNRASVRWRLEAFLWALPWVWVASARAHQPEPGEASKSLADMSLEELMTVQTSPFEVSANLDDRYLASNEDERPFWQARGNRAARARGPACRRPGRSR